MFDDIVERTMSHIAAGAESILGGVRQRLILQNVIKFDNEYIKKLLIHEDAENLMTLKFEKIALDEHYARLYGPAVLLSQDKLGLMLNQKHVDLDLGNQKRCDQRPTNSLG